MSDLTIQPFFINGLKSKYFLLSKVPQGRYSQILKGNLQDQADAFDELLKSNSIECYWCNGTGVDKVDMGVCCLCDMEGIICAFCHMHDGCECGTPTKEAK